LATFIFFMHDYFPYLPMTGGHNIHFPLWYASH
jgi:hypothetical protein